MSRLPNPNALPESGVATKQMVAEFLGVSTKTIDRMNLPRSANLGSKTVRFPVDVVRKLYGVI